MNSNETKKQEKVCTLIDGAVLSPELLKHLKDLQADGNSYIDSTKDMLSRTIALLATSMECPPQQDAIMRLISDIGYLYQDMDKFKNPTI